MQHLKETEILTFFCSCRFVDDEDHETDMVTSLLHDQRYFHTITGSHVLLADIIMLSVRTK